MGQSSQDTVTQIALQVDPALAKPSTYVKAFTHALNDKWPEAEKSTPEIEWRRMRDLWAKLSLLSKGLTAMVRDLEKNSSVSETLDSQIKQAIGPSNDPYDPLSFQNSNYGAGGSGNSAGVTTGGGSGAPGGGGQNFAVMFGRLRSAVSGFTQITLETRGMVDLYLPAVHWLAEQVSQLAMDTKAAFDALGDSGGINSVDYRYIDEGVTVSGDYGAVADPPLSSYDWGTLG